MYQRCGRIIVYFSRLLSSAYDGNMHIPKGKTEAKTRNGGTEHDEESQTDQ